MTGTKRLIKANQKSSPTVTKQEQWKTMHFNKLVKEETNVSGRKEEVNKSMLSTMPSVSEELVNVS